ncbi:MAG: hypothetical protein LBG42_06565 [Treponema sp.]|nr:hypothetical protein [Treponema sp.]
MAGRRSFNARLLTLMSAAVFMLVPSFTKAEELTLMTESFPETPGNGSFWTFVILADHPRPDEVTVRTAPLPPGLSPETVRISIRHVRPEGARGPGRPWTEIRYRFAVNGRGKVTLGPFTVSAGGKTSETAALILDIAGPDEEREKILVWEGPASLAIGKEALFILRFAPHVSAAGTVIDGAALLAGPLPRGAIVERFLPRERERAGGALLCVRVIPLEGPLFILPERRYAAGEKAFIAPAIRIPVR